MIIFHLSQAFDYVSMVAFREDDFFGLYVVARGGANSGALRRVCFEEFNCLI